MHAIMILAALWTTTEARWSGMVADDAKLSRAPEHGVITDAESWRQLWRSWRPDRPLPEVDFQTQLIVVGTVPGPNLVLMRPKLDQGDLKFAVGGTRRGGPGFGYLLLAVDRSGVKSVNGKRLPGTSPSNGEAETESISVRIVGVLKTGIVAIGGETTGTAITANNISWELEFSDDGPTIESLETLEGRKVLVTGTLELRPGVELPARWIVTVSSLKPMAE